MAEYIIREQAKQAIYEYILQQTVSKYPSEELCKASRMGAEGAMYEIDYVPAADVAEVVHSKWERSDKEYSYYQYKCSNCGCDDYTQTDRNGKCKLMNYCPHCGAKMDKEAVDG